MNYQAPKIEWIDQKKLDENKVEIEDWHQSIAETLIHSYKVLESMTQDNKIMVHYYNKQTKKGEPYISCPNFNDVSEAKEWVEQTHYPSALRKAGFKPVSQEALEPTVYRLDYFDDEYYWYLVHSYDREELEKLIADATEYHKTIKDLDFEDNEAVDAWLEKHPLNDFNGDSIIDLLEIDDYEPLSAYLSINSFEVSGVSKMTQLSNVPMQPKPDAVERPMTLIEKLEQVIVEHNTEFNKIIKDATDHQKIAHTAVLAGLLSAIKVAKQHQTWRKMPSDEKPQDMQVCNLLVKNESEESPTLYDIGLYGEFDSLPSLK